MGNQKKLLFDDCFNKALEIEDAYNRLHYDTPKDLRRIVFAHISNEEKLHQLYELRKLDISDTLKLSRFNIKF